MSSYKAIWHAKRREELQKTIDKDSLTLHSWAKLWIVVCTVPSEMDVLLDPEIDPKYGGRKLLLFNPKHNLNSASGDDKTTAALTFIAECNEVRETRMRLCDVPMSLCNPHRLDVTQLAWPQD